MKCKKQKKHWVDEPFLSFKIEKLWNVILKFKIWMQRVKFITMFLPPFSFFAIQYKLALFYKQFQKLNSIQIRNPLMHLTYESHLYTIHSFISLSLSLKLYIGIISQLIGKITAKREDKYRLVVSYLVWLLVKNRQVSYTRQT